MEGICKLCLKQDRLYKSHILPKFIFRKIIEDGKLSILNNSKIFDISTNGYKEFLLCFDCEKKLGNYETYSSKVLSNLNKSPFKISDNGIFKIYENIEYKRIKLFVLSILWRSSIASDNFFCDINLNKKHEEKIRLLLLSDDPGMELEYPFFLYEIEKDKSHSPDTDDIHLTIKKPYSNKMNGHHIYIFICLGVVFYIFASSHMETIGNHLNSPKLNNFLYIPIQKIKPDFLKEGMIEYIIKNKISF